MEKTVYQLIVLTSIIHLVDTLAYSVRLNAVKTGQFALSISLFNIFVLISRTANTFQAPLIGSLIGKSITSNIDPTLQLRLVIFSATLGTLIGIIFIPTFLKIFNKVIKRLGSSGSISAIIIGAFQISNIKRLVKTTVRPSKKMLHNLKFTHIPKTLLFLNVVITGIYTIGVLSANYSATFVAEEQRLAAAASAGMINGIATILLTLFIDPKAAIITDQALKGERPYEDVKTLVLLLIVTKLLGTILGQFLLIPSAELIAKIYR